MDQAAADARWMDAALAFARRGFGTTAPNPCVGALVVRGGVLVGRGVTAPGGRPHAEPLALAEAGEAARGATLYVTLEPCSHVGRGAPCVAAVLASGIARVVAAMQDPDPRVAGQGIAALRAAGLAVSVGPGAARAERDLRGHLARIRCGRPAVTLKLAETADGIAAAAPGAPRLIVTGEVARGWVHVARAMHDAVLVGAGTARNDDPLLTVRLPGFAGRQPLRIVLDPRVTLDPASHLARSRNAAPVLLLHGPAANAARLAAVTASGVATAAIPLGAEGGLDLRAALRLLADRGMTRVFCEGGPTLGAALLRHDLVDEVVVLTGAATAGPGRPAFDAPARARLADAAAFRLVEDRPLGADRLRRYERTEPCSPD